MGECWPSSEWQHSENYRGQYCSENAVFNFIQIFNREQSNWLLLPGRVDQGGHKLDRVEKAERGELNEARRAFRRRVVAHDGECGLEESLRIGGVFQSSGGVGTGRGGHRLASGPVHGVLEQRQEELRYELPVVLDSIVLVSGLAVHAVVVNELVRIGTLVDVQRGLFHGQVQLLHQELHEVVEIGRRGHGRRHGCVWEVDCKVEGIGDQIARDSVIREPLEERIKEEEARGGEPC
mmetsp:Transcript_7688/g.13898  ORF Transcript_7688/g.13898 Transcript_7688/m.13898 type:complete len:236 (-) Transcript_7688:1716-2423(-)